MVWRDRLMLTLAITFAVLPLFVSGVLILRRKKYMHLKRRRYRAAMIGLILGLAASVPVPLFYFLLELPSAAGSEWLLAAANNGMPVAIGLGLVAIGLLGFARGKVRWAGISSAAVTLAMLYVTILGLSQ